ncbi:hypothetical protein B0T25DRAFT_504750 [Lasiosphaeria hispida]|uniref:AAA+ ATPase domain-containing protein n=1 Tax=Lasiosphaeria hispida TaxID=260671 RepID=A0AAJ0MCT7_9PEZI|nr:hypothetical protein B0T25DRAFT_504750 [Lasiosphaeria hispida]
MADPDTANTAIEPEHGVAKSPPNEPAQDATPRLQIEPDQKPAAPEQSAIEKAAQSLVDKLESFKTKLTANFDDDLAELKRVLKNRSQPGSDNLRPMPSSLSRVSIKDDDDDRDSDASDDNLVCEVEKLPMDLWRKTTNGVGSNKVGYNDDYYANYYAKWYANYYTKSDSKEKTPRTQKKSEAKYIIKAFYRNVPLTSGNPAAISTDEDFKLAHANRPVDRPLRVLIDTHVLLDELEEISELTLQDLPLVLIPPFKLLVHNWPKIQSTLSKLQNELAKSEAEEDEAPKPRDHGSPGNLAADSTSDWGATLSQPDGSAAGALGGPPDADVPRPQATSQLEARVNQLQCLHDFIKTDLGNLIGLRLKVAEGSLETVTFDEVYYLFHPGDLIMASGIHESQLYQVYSVTGGRVRLSKATRGEMGDMEMEEDRGFATSGIGTWTDVTLETYMMCCDGTQVGTFQVTHSIKHFSGERRVTDLEVYPLQFHKSPADLCAQLQARGLKFLNCFGHKKYDAITVRPPATILDEDNSPPGGFPRRPLIRGHTRYYHNDSGVPEKERIMLEEIQSDIFVDLQSHYRLHPSAKFSTVLRKTYPNSREVVERIPGQRDREYNSGDHDVDEALTDDFLLSQRNFLQPAKPGSVREFAEILQLLPHQIPAYEFRSRQWVWLDVDKIEEIDKSDEARHRGWNDLVIPDSYRQLLVSLVDNHTSGTENQIGGRSRSTRESPAFQIDLVRGKGRGLIILLHGPPGSGKTSTAETIAAYTGRPLYSITCGDIGVTADQVESRLQYHTELAAKWGCVLLLDEADVFLMRRSWDNMERNALVSVFLRHLEYYSGILFLTTNIVGVIDEAFKSRIHVALRYPSIDLHSTEKMWNNLLNRIAKDNETAKVKIEFNRTSLLDYASSHYHKHEQTDSTWNGRQVRNAFQTAIALGHHERLMLIKDEGLTLDQALQSSDKSLKTVRLTKRNFVKISRTARDFEDYITAIRGPDRKVAQKSQFRDDDFGKPILMPQKYYPTPTAGGSGGGSGGGGGGGGSGSGPRRESLRGPGRGYGESTPPPTGGRSRREREVAPRAARYQDDEDDDPDDPDDEGDEVDGSRGGRGRHETGQRDDGDDGEDDDY